MQKGGATTPQLYHSRLFVKQTIGFGGKRVAQESGPMQLGKTDDSRKLVLVAGNFSILDFFDKNAFDIDPRQGFLGLGFLTYAAYDFASDARGYSYGGVAELDWDDWAVRVGRITPPKDPNQLAVDFRLFKNTTETRWNWSTTTSFTDATAWFACWRTAIVRIWAASATQ